MTDQLTDEFLGTTYLTIDAETGKVRRSTAEEFLESRAAIRVAVRESAQPGALAMARRVLSCVERDDSETP
jgi:hypothetical protein